MKDNIEAKFREERRLLDKILDEANTKVKTPRTNTNSDLWADSLRYALKGITERRLSNVTIRLPSGEHISVSKAKELWEDLNKIFGHQAPSDPYSPPATTTHYIPPGRVWYTNANKL